MCNKGASVPVACPLTYALTNGTEPPTNLCTNPRADLGTNLHTDLCTNLRTNLRIIM